MSESAERPRGNYTWRMRSDCHAEHRRAGTTRNLSPNRTPAVRCVGVRPPPATASSAVGRTVISDLPGEKMLQKAAEAGTNLSRQQTAGAKGEGSHVPRGQNCIRDLCVDRLWNKNKRLIHKIQFICIRLTAITPTAQKVGE